MQSHGSLTCIIPSTPCTSSPPPYTGKQCITAVYLPAASFAFAPKPYTGYMLSLS